MLLDELTEFADGVAVAGAAGTYNVGDIIDTGAVARDIGVGKQPLICTVIIDTAPTGADTCKFQLVSDATSTIATDGSQTVHHATDDIAIASLPAGTIAMQFVLPREGEVYERYLAIQQVNVGASALADLVVSAFLSLDAPETRSYPDAAN